MENQNDPPRPETIANARRRLSLGLVDDLPPDSHPGWDRLLDDVLDAEEFEADAPRFDADFGK
ncbi:MAG: hypothetical protein WAN65_12610 [Candidatus Sulfotelmatobacter sp.]